MADLDEADNEWEQLNRTNWRGLGLTDPIKSVEVRLKLHFAVCFKISRRFLQFRTNGCYYQLFSRSRVS